MQRIKQPTYCVGISFQEVDGDALRALKMRCNEACGGVVKYGGGHHCSLAYVPDREHIIGDVGAIIQHHGQKLVGLDLTVDSICLERGRDVVELHFGDGAARPAPPPTSQQKQFEASSHKSTIKATERAADGGYITTETVEMDYNPPPPHLIPLADGGGGHTQKRRPARGGAAAAQTPSRTEPSAYDQLRQLHNSCKRDLIKNHVRRGMHVLDVGCGRGGDLGKWKDAGASYVHCVDPHEESLVGPNGVNERSAYINFPVTTQTGTVLDVVSGEFDIVCYNFSLHYIAPRLSESCTAIAQRLRPGGLLIGICPDYDSIIAMGCPFTDSLGNSFRMQDNDTLFVKVADPSAPFYAGCERAEPVLHRQLLQRELQGLGVQLQSWQPMLRRRNGLISDMYSTFVFRKA